MKVSTKIYLVMLLAFSTVESLAYASSRLLDIRERLLVAARKGDKEFPDGKDVVLTHFAYVGKLQTRTGVIYVVNLRSVLNNMPAPRGLNYIVFFNQRYHHRYRWLGKLNYAASMPLWCEQGRLYLFGELDVPSNLGEGNVIDLTAGYKRMKIYRQKKYGSSGGTLDGDA